MTPLQFACPACKGQLKISNPALAGKKIKCPKCGAVVRAPALAADSEAVESVKPAAPAKVPAAAKPSAPPPRREEPPPLPPRRRPAKQAAKRGGGLLAPIAAAVLAFVYLGAVVATFLGYLDTLLLGDLTPRQAGGGQFKLDLKKRPDVPLVGGPGFPIGGKGPSKLPAPDPVEVAQRDEQRQQQLAAAQAADKKLIASWQKQGGRGLTLRVFPIEEFGAPNHLAVSADGQWLAANKFRDVVVWDRLGNQAKWTFKENDDFIQSLAFAGDGKSLAINYDKKLVLVDLATGQPRKQLQRDNKTVLEIAWSPDSKTLAGVGVFEGARLWDAQTGELLPGIAGQGFRFYQSVAFTPDGRHLLLNGGDGVQAFNPADGSLVASLTQSNEGSGKLQVSPDGKFIAVIATDFKNPERILIVDPTTGSKRELRTPWNQVHSLAISADGKRLVATGRGNLADDAAIKIWDVASGKENATLGGKELHLGGLPRFSPGGALLFTVKAPGIYAYDIEVLLDAGKLQAALESQKTAGKILDQVKQWANVDQIGNALRVNARTDVTDAQLSQLKNVAKVTSLSLNSADKLTDAGLAILTDLPDLESLTLSYARGLTDDALAPVKSCAKLRELRLGPSQKFGDAGLSHLTLLTELQLLDLNDTKVTDTGLSQLKGLVNLKTLLLRRAKVTPKGLANLKDMTEMLVLNLEDLPVTNDGMAHLAGMKELNDLWLMNADISDDGLVHLRKMTKLVRLSLHQNPITGSGLVNLTGMGKLEELMIGASQLNDAGLANVKGLTKLRTLNISGTQVTDAGFAHLAGMTGLQQLYVTNLPGLTGPGLKHLQTVTGLRDLDLSETGVTDEGLANLKDLTHLQGVTLPKQATDAALAHLAGLTNLDLLGLNGLKGLNGPGLKHLKKLPKLTGLYLQDTGVTDEGLASLKDLTQLKSLSLPPQISDAGLVHVKGLAKLESLNLYRSKVTDAGLVHLEGLPNLRSLDVGDTKVTDSGGAALKKKLPKLNVQR